MKKIIFILCLLMSLPIMAQKKTFKAACLNVDGLPPSVKAGGIINVNLNPEGPQETGTLRMSELIAQKGWDFFAVSENFNYNDQLMNSLQGFYNAGTFRGQITNPSISNAVSALQGKWSFDTDGLNLLWKSNIRASNEAWFLWNQRNGITDAGSDQLIKKGYRYYTVKIDNGLELDVYILHMDAETSDADNAARASQITQLVNAILETHNKRPILIMGDTNCRYTRDDLKGLLFDRINADERFEIRDPWIDFQWDGVMPTLGSASIMTDQYGHQKGEVVDKIFYINNTEADGIVLTANSYLHDTDFSYADGSEISDHYPIVINFTIENTNTGVTEGEYYLRNLQSGKFLNQGGMWGTHAVTADYGNLLSLEKADGENNFYIHSTAGYIKTDGGIYLDGEKEIAQVFTFKPTDQDGIYQVLAGENALTAYPTDIAGYELPSDRNSRQLWQIITKTELTKELYEASEAAHKNATFFIKGAAFNRNDSEVSSWTLTTGKGTQLSYNLGGINDVSDSNYLGEFYNPKFTAIMGNKTSNGTLTQTITGLPNGKYRISCQNFTRNGNQDFYISANSVKFSINNIDSGAQSEQIHSGATQSGNSWVPNDIASAAAFFNLGLYTSTIDLTITNHQLDLIINKPNTTSSTWFCFDNFVLEYLGETAEDRAALERVKAAIDDAQAKADEMHYYNYDNSTVEERYENRTITGDGSTEIHMTYIQLANAAKAINSIPGDMRYVILNNSFELGDLTEWDASMATNARITDASNINGHNGNYVFEANGGTLTQQLQVTMPAGIYTLRANLSNGARLVADGKTSEPAQSSNGLVEVAINFPIQNGSASIGVTSDAAFVADNFRLERIGNAENANAYEIVRKAIEDATTQVNAMGTPYNENWDLSSYQSLVDNYLIEGDGWTEFYEIYGLLREQVYRQKGEEVDMTRAIINPSFEFGSTLGWDTINSSDTGARENSNSIYKVNNAHGDYVFNTYWQGTPLKQTLYGLPAGHYILKAKANTGDTDETQYVFLMAGDQISEPLEVSIDKASFSEIEFEFDVAETSDVTIGIVGGNSDGTYNEAGAQWYKADDFRLTLVGEADMTVFYEKLKRAMDRTSAIVANLPEKYSSQWNLSKYQDIINNQTLQGDASTEINEIYALMRELIFSQTELGADMSGAIMNMSFELGDMTGWQCDTGNDTGVKPNNNAVYTVDNCDGDYLFNTWDSDRAMPLTQTIVNVPAGFYRLKARVASDNNNQFFLAVNDMPGEIVTTTEKTHLEEISVDFEISEDGTDIIIGIYPAVNGAFSADAIGAWFKADDFSLTFLGRNVTTEWEMEGQTYDTMILPFDAEIPEGLEVYTAENFDAVDSNDYHLMMLVAQTGIEANKPYIVKRVSNTTPEIPEDDAQEVSLFNRTNTKVKARIGGEKGTSIYSFIGIPVNDEDIYSFGLLTGTLSGVTPQEGDYILCHEPETSLFRPIAGIDDSTLVKANHAYIAAGTGNAPTIYLEAEQIPEDNDQSTGVKELLAEGSNIVDVYTTAGTVVKRQVSVAEALTTLQPGIYILTDGTLTAKIIKR